MRRAPRSSLRLRWSALHPDVIHHRQALAVATGEIGNVTDSLISSIAAQTNLLALNATNKRRAPEKAGRASAVVAQEVKAPAARRRARPEEIARSEEGGAHRDRTVRRHDLGDLGETIRMSSTNFRRALQVQLRNIAATSQQIANNGNAVTDSVGQVGKAIVEIEGVAVEVSRAATKVNSAP